ncbi:MAG: hypothetical protein VKK42_26315 [Lyngbya sp.]|nr:hypothetical protein [Lyngbya sp.]
MSLVLLTWGGRPTTTFGNFTRCCAKSTLNLGRSQQQLLGISPVIALFTFDDFLAL